LVVEVAPEDALALEATLAGSSFTRLGVVTERQQLSLAVDGTPTIELSVAELVSAWSRQPEGVTP
jgi:hypothetical protein